MKTANNYMAFSILYITDHRIIILLLGCEVPVNNINYSYCKLMKNISGSGEY